LTLTCVGQVIKLIASESVKQSSGMPSSLQRKSTFRLCQCVSDEISPQFHGDAEHNRYRPKSASIFGGIRQHRQTVTRPSRF